MCVPWPTATQTPLPHEIPLTLVVKGEEMIGYQMEPSKDVAIVYVTPVPPAKNMIPLEDTALPTVRIGVNWGTQPTPSREKRIPEPWGEPTATQTPCAQIIPLQALEKKLPVVLL